MTASEPLLQLRDVQRRFAAPHASRASGASGASESAPHQSVKVLSGVDLSLDAGESLAIVGPSGSGKSTLLHLIATLDEPSSGSLRLAGRELTSLSANERAEVRSTSIGLVFQSHHLLPQLTALDNVLVPTLARPASQREAAARRGLELLKRVGLGDRASHRPDQLSGGECQRVAVVRALINSPRLLLADEPTGSLDGASASAMGELLVELKREENVALIVVTHSPALADRMDRTLHLLDGRLVEGAENAR